MSDNNEPLQSFSGSAENVRKHAMRYLSDEQFNSDDGLQFMSLEHAAYIGYELLKAEIMTINYEQDCELKLTSDKSDSQLLKEYATENKTNIKTI
jgi:hypothetical protein